MNIFGSHSNPQTIQADDVVARYYEPIYRHIRRLVVSHDDACDVCQETFLKALRSLHKLKKAEALRPWLYRIATNEAMRFISSQRLGDEQITETLTATLVADAPQNSPDPRLLKFNEALLTLTAAQRTIFNLRHYDELSYNDIAQIINSTPETARVVYFQAKEKLKHFLLANNIS